MNNDPGRFSIDRPETVRLKIKRSEFVCTLSPVKDMVQAKSVISRISKENKSATHNCWAYIVGDNAQYYHSSDAGEPAGTAGKPMLNALFHHHLTDVAAVVTRHYGGVKLGVKGLMDAYYTAVDQAIESACLKRRVKTVQVAVDVAYEYNETVLSTIKSYDVVIQNSEYAQTVTHTLEIEEASWESVFSILEKQQSMKRLTFTVFDKAD